jgi:hypothetical protein
MGAGQTVGLEEYEEQLWDEVKGELDNACSESVYASEPQFREWFEIVAYWDFTNGACDYDYHIKEGDSEQVIWYKRHILKEENGPFAKLYDWVANLAEISFSQAGRIRCKTPDSLPVLFEYYHTYDRENEVWEGDEFEQKFNTFVSEHPIDHIPLAIEHYAEKGGIAWGTNWALGDLVDAET